MQTPKPLSSSPISTGEGRGRILEAAIKLFAARGYNGVSISDVAQSANVVKSAIYYHFPSKEALYVAVLQETCSQSCALMDAAAQGATWLERLRGAALTLGRLMGPRSHVFTLILERIAQVSAENSPISAGAVTAFRHEFVSVLRREISAGIAAGDLEPIDPHLASYCLVGLIAAALQVAPGTFDEGQIDFALNLFLHGVSKNRNLKTSVS